MMVRANICSKKYIKDEGWFNPIPHYEINTGKGTGMNNIEEDLLPVYSSHRARTKLALPVCKVSRKSSGAGKYSHTFGEETLTS